MCQNALRSLALKSHVIITIAWHSVVGYVVGRFEGKEPLLTYLREVYAPHVVRVLAWHGIPITIKGDTSVLRGGVLVLAPHECMLDAVLGHLRELGGRPAYLAKAILFRIPFFGQCMRMAGMIPIYDGGDIRVLLRQVTASLKDGRAVIVFPERTRVKPPHSFAEYGRSIKLFTECAKRSGVRVVQVHFGDWHHVWGPPRTLFTARPQPVVVCVEEQK